MTRTIIILFCLVLLSGCSVKSNEEQKQKTPTKASEEPKPEKPAFHNGKLIIGEYTYNSIEDFLKENELVFRGKINAIEVEKIESKFNKENGTEYYACLKIEIEETYWGVEKEKVIDLKMGGYASKEEIYKYFQKDLSYICAINYLQRSKRWMGGLWELGHTPGITETSGVQISAQEVLNAAENIKKEENE